MIKTDYLIVGLLNVILFLGLQLQLANSSNITNSNNNISILCSEVRILNSLVQDTEVLPSTAAGNSTSERECGFKPNIAPEALEKAENQSKYPSP
jgi:hypothetical protein